MQLSQACNTPMCLCCSLWELLAVRPSRMLIRLDMLYDIEFLTLAECLIKSPKWQKCLETKDSSGINTTQLCLKQFIRNATNKTPGRRNMFY